MNLLHMELVNRCILISDCNLFFIVMSEPKKRKLFSIQERMEILEQVDASEETCCTD
jgi:phosphopantetheine adenylyltransferase